MNQKTEIGTRREALKKLFKSVGLIGVGAAVGTSVLKDSATQDQHTHSSDKTKETLDYLNEWETLID